MTWKKIKKGDIVQISSFVYGTLIAKVIHKSNDIAHSKVLVGKSYTSKKYYLFNKLACDKGKIKVLNKKLEQLLFK